MKKFIKKIFLAMTGLVLILVAGLTLASCASGIKGNMNLTIYRTILNVDVTFDSNSKLDESSTKVTVELYNANDEYQTSQTISLKSYVGNTKFENLTEDTSYGVKLFVTYGGYKEQIDTKTFKTKNDGTDEKTAIEVSSVESFLKITDDKDAYYKLTCDLDLKDNTNIALFTNTSDAFAGTFDGQGHKISNINLAANEYAGLFECLSKATIKNLTLENVTCSVSSTVKFLGALFGYAVDSTIEDVTVRNVSFVSTSITTSNSNFGCFAGYNESTSVKNVKLENAYLSTPDVRPSTSYNSSIGVMFSTIAGKSPIENAYCEGSLVATVKTTGKVYVGGFAGSISSADLIKDSTFAGLVKVNRNSTTADSLYVGGFGGTTAQGQANLDNCLAIADISVSSEPKDDAEETTVSIAKYLYVGGIMGNVASTQIGVKNSKYLALKDGIRVLNIEPSTDSTTAKVGLVSLTIAKVQSSVENKVVDNVSLSDTLNSKGATVVDSTVDTSKLTEDISKTKENAKCNVFVNLEEVAVKALFTATSYSTATNINLAPKYNTTIEVVLPTDSKTLTYEDNMLKITPIAEETNEQLTIKITLGTYTKEVTISIKALSVKA